MKYKITLWDKWQMSKRWRDYEGNKRGIIATGEKDQYEEGVECVKGYNIERDKDCKRWHKEDIEQIREERGEVMKGDAIVTG